MTAYFDRCADQAQAGGNSAIPYKELRQVEQKLVFDVTVCSQFPGFPEDLAARIHLAILNHAFEERPVNRRNHPRIDEFKTIEDAWRELGVLVGELHSIFHALAKRNLPGFSDDPLAPIRGLYTRGEEVRETIEWP